jgi:predicted amidohydrolase YtcJ
VKKLSEVVCLNQTVGCLLNLVYPGITLEPAFASFTESILGSLTSGKRADYVVLSKDILTIPAAEILSTKVLATVLDGRVAYGRV